MDESSVAYYSTVNSSDTPHGESSMDATGFPNEACSISTMDESSSEYSTISSSINLHGDGKRKPLRNELIVVGIIAIFGFSLGLAALVKVLNDTQTELSALRQSNTKLKENFENLTMNFQNLSGRLTNLSRP